MSLLIDALKKAEQAKQAGESKTEAPRWELALEPTSPRAKGSGANDGAAIAPKHPNDPNSPTEAVPMPGHPELATPPDAKPADKAFQTPAAPAQTAFVTDGLPQFIAPAFGSPVGPMALNSKALPELPRLEDLDEEFLAHSIKQTAPPKSEETAKNPSVDTQISSPKTSSDPSSPVLTFAQEVTAPPPSPAANPVEPRPVQAEAHDGGAAVLVNAAAKTIANTKPVASETADHKASGAAHQQLAPTAAQERDSIRNAFAVKQKPRNRAFLWLVGVGSLMAVLAIGAYFWFQMQPGSGLLLAQKPGAGNAPPITSAPSTAGTASTTAMAGSSGSPAGSATPSLASAPKPLNSSEQAGTPSQPNARSAADVEMPLAKKGLPNTVAASGSQREPRSARELPPRSAATSDTNRSRERHQGRRSGNATDEGGATEAPNTGRRPSTKREARSSSDNENLGSGGKQTAVNGLAMTGYEAYQAGHLEAAKSAYDRLLRADPWNQDALQGLAAIAMRENRTNDAEALYGRILEGNPRDPTALAGLMGLRSQRGQGDPVSTEGRIKFLLSTQPESPALQFALGNQYARQSRWSEAQQAYFQALAGDPANPDYLFNLAVSLDQLHQVKLAGFYYRQALTAAENRQAAFNREQAEIRLKELQP